MLLCQMCCYYLLLSVFDMFFSLHAECKTTGNHLIFLAKGNVLPIISSYKNELGKLLDILLQFKAWRLEIHRNSAEVSTQNSSNYEIQKNPAAQTVRLVKVKQNNKKFSNLTNFSTILNTAKNQTKNKFNGSYN